MFKYTKCTAGERLDAYMTDENKLLEKDEATVV
jgi:hypothetical protein